MVCFEAKLLKLSWRSIIVIERAYENKLFTWCRWLLRLKRQHPFRHLLKNALKTHISSHATHTILPTAHTNFITQPAIFNFHQSLQRRRHHQEDASSSPPLDNPSSSYSAMRDIYLLPAASHNRPCWYHHHLHHKIRISIIVPKLHRSTRRQYDTVGVQ